MAVNNFLPFAGSAGSNVLTQAEYAALPSRTSGFAAGVAKSAELNKVWRQSSIIAAVIGQLINDSTGQDALDDGTTATLLANLKASIKSQSLGVVGSARNLSMQVAAASATATLTADEIIVESALGGLTYRLASFSKTINLATTGAGGMGTGTVPANGYVALYAIYNPTTGASALLAVNATSVVAPEVYGGANMPSGYTASALVSVWRTASSQFVAGYQFGRQFSSNGISAATTSVAIASYTAVDISATVPRNAKFIWGDASVRGTSPDSLAVTLAANNLGFGSRQTALTSASGGNSYSNTSFPGLPLITPQTVYWRVSINTGTLTSAGFTISQYEF